jgi:hypothetical protein
MINTNWIILLLGLVAAFALSMDKKNNTLVEGFAGGMPQRRALIDAINVNNMQSLSAPMQAPAIVGQSIASPRLGGDMRGQFVSYPSFQASVSPRFNSVGTNPYLRSKRPDEKHMATPSQALGYPNSVKVMRTSDDYAKMVTKEGYCGSIGGGDYGGFMIPNYHADEAAYQKMAKNLDKNTIVDMVPVGGMDTVTSDGNIENVRVVDRYIYSNLKSRLQGNNDLIRGSLAITPCQRGWFSVPANPARDLNAGALAVMGGLNNENAQDVWALQSKYSGNVGQTQSSIAGLSFDPTGFKNSRMTLEKNVGMLSDEGINTVTAYNPPMEGKFNVIATAFP